MVSRRSCALLVYRTYASFGSNLPASPVDSFKAKDLQVELCLPSQRQPKPDWDNLKFGHHFSDHMLVIEWSQAHGWNSPKVSPFHNLSLHPAAKVLHYATELFEGMKAYRGVDNKIRLFRPDLNMKRMRRTAVRCCLPDFDGEELLKCIDGLIRIDQEWVPYSTSSSLYIRPTFIGIDPVLGIGHSEKALLFVIVGPVGAYYPTGWKPIGLYADPQYVRSWPGGVGYTKAGSNYGPAILIGKIALEYGCQQALWLYGPDEQVTEVGTMNLLCFLTNNNGERELVTAPLTDGLILPGVTRQSLLEITRSWNEFKVRERYLTMKELTAALEEGRVMQIFGAGTACVVSPVDRIFYKRGNDSKEYFVPTMKQSPSLMQRLYDAITDIQYGRVSKPEWIRTVVE